MAACVANKDQHRNLEIGGLSALDGVIERAIIGCANPAENIGAGKMSWQHRFHVRHLSLQPSVEIPLHVRYEEEVIIVQQGELLVDIDGHTTTLSPGDVFTAPIDQPRRYLSQAQQPLDAFIVRRGNHPLAAKFV